MLNEMIGPSKAELKARTADLANCFDSFRQRQTVYGGIITADDKRTLRDKLNALSVELDKYLAVSYGKKHENAKEFEQWRASHLPLHWFAEFYGIMRDGGFDVVIGNPPFVENTTRNVQYSLVSSEYHTIMCGNLYAYVAERCFKLCTQNNGNFSFIMPSASLCTPRMTPLFDGIISRFKLTMISIWDERPSKLFDGVDQQLSIYVCMSNRQINLPIFITCMQHWSASERSHIFSTLYYIAMNNDMREASVVPKFQNHIELSILEKIRTKVLHNNRQQTQKNKSKLYYKNAGGRYWRLIKSFPTFFQSERGASQTSTEKFKYVDSDIIKLYVGILSANIFYWYWRIVSNCRHLTERELDNFPIMPTNITRNYRLTISKLTDLYEKDIKKKAVRLTTYNNKSGRIIQDSFKIYLSKGIIDKIDTQISKIYKLNDEELDFIINYDIKYRMGGTDEE